MLAAADVIVLPFLRSLHSGSMIHAISEGRPVVTPDLPFAEALGREVGPGWINTYSGDLTFELMADCPIPASPPDLRALAPAVVADQTLRFYEDLIAAKRARRR